MRTTFDDANFFYISRPCTWNRNANVLQKENNDTDFRGRYVRVYTVVCVTRKSKSTNTRDNNNNNIFSLFCSPPENVRLIRFMRLDWKIAVEPLNITFFSF